MTPANLEFSIAITLLAFIVFAGILGLIFRDLGRDQNEHDDMTSERIPEVEQGRVITSGRWITDGRTFIPKELVTKETLQMVLEHPEDAERYLTTIHGSDFVRHK